MGGGDCVSALGGVGDCVSGWGICDCDVVLSTDNVETCLCVS